MKMVETKTKNQAQTGGSVDLVWCLSLIVMLLLISVGGFGVLSGCGNTEKPVDATLEISLGAVGPGAGPVVLHVGDYWRHVIEDVTIVVESLDLKASYIGVAISINGSQNLHVNIDINHFCEVVVNNVDYTSVVSVHR